MYPVISKTLGGLSTPYYFRNFFFGLLFVVFFIFMASKSTSGIQIGSMLLVVTNALLYPYSRFVYESIVEFIVGRNVFYTSAFLMLSVKFISMSMCFILAIFIAPVGLAYLYYRHSKA